MAFVFCNMMHGFGVSLQMAKEIGGLLPWCTILHG